jgi:hypothetical protein
VVVERLVLPRAGTGALAAVAAAAVLVTARVPDGAVGVVVGGVVVVVSADVDRGGSGVPRARARVPRLARPTLDRLEYWVA